MDIGAIILAGGKSSRMGTNKALLTINERTNIERIITRLHPVFPDPILVTNDPAAYHHLGLKTVSDYFPGKGPLAGIHAGLIASPHETNIIVACDMPFVSAELAAALAEKSADYEAVVPVIDGKQQPLFALYKKHLTGVLEDTIQSGRLRIRDLLDRLKVLYLTEKDLKSFESLERIFFNMNRPEEYEEALQLVKDEQPERGK